MASAAQVSANQANAQSSTGPRTPEGKARVSHNALHHGLTAQHLVIRPDEQDEFTALQDELLAELDPQGAIETVTFHELLHAAWSLHRFRRIEAECSSGAAADFAEPSTTTVLDRIGRYQSRAQRAYYKALQELRTLQTNRALRSFKLDENDEPEVPAITNINELTKQTHSEVKAEAIKQAINMLNYETGVFLSQARQNYQARTAASSSPTPINAGKTPTAPSPGVDSKAQRTGAKPGC